MRGIHLREAPLNSSELVVIKCYDELKRCTGAVVVVVAVEVDAAQEGAPDLLEIAVRRGVDGLLDLLLAG